MQVSETGLNLIKHFEGFSEHAYLDPVGIPTIGYGFTSYPSGSSSVIQFVKSGDKLSREKSDKILEQYVEDYGHAVLDLVQIPLTQNQFDALVCFVYNIGISAFKDSTMLKLINKGYLADASKQFSRWVHAGDQILPGLVRRREAERKLFVS